MTKPVRTQSAEQQRPAIGLGPWNFYFLAKLLLLWKGLIGFHALENLAFALFLLVPSRSSLGRRLKTALAVPVAVALLYHDSWLPPVGRVLSQAVLVSNFSAAYLAELAGRFISWPVVAALVITWAAYRLVSQRVRVGVLVITALLILTFNQTGNDGLAPTTAQAAVPAANAEGEANASGPAAALRAFYAKEAGRRVTFTAPAPEAVPFDVVFIHICSLSWDDLRAVGLENHPLWQRFDVLFKRFNAASTYSGPAAIRIQRANCGQTSHSALYSAAPDNCYLMGSLQRVGFRSDLVLNHDGHFDDFLQVIQGQGLNVAPLPLAGLPIAQRAFDDSPIYGDRAVLARWLEQRSKSDSTRVAAYYNSVSLHDGNRLLGAGPGNSLDTYKARLSRLLDDLDRFMKDVESSGRRALVVVIPEHGAAVRGDKMQIAGLREIPSPALTLVPVGLKVIGPNVQRTGSPAQVDAPTSFLAVSHLVARLLEDSPYGTRPFAPQEWAADLPTTEFVAENEDMVVIQQGERVYLGQGTDQWMDYPE